MAAQIKDSYCKQLDEFNLSLLEVLCRGFALSDDQVYEFLSENEREMHEFTVKEMVSVVRSGAN